MCQYVIKNSICFSQDIGTYTSFGINAISENGDIVATVSDISSDEAFVKGLADLCMKMELSPIHLYDVVEDKLAEMH